MKYLTIILAVLLLLLQYDLWVGDGSIANVWRLQQSLEVQQAENQKLRERNAALEAEVRDLKQGMEAIEARARNELGMIRKDETFVQIINKKSDEGRGTSAEGNKSR